MRLEQARELGHERRLRSACVKLFVEPGDERVDSLMLEQRPCEGVTRVVQRRDERKEPLLLFSEVGDGLLLEKPQERSCGGQRVARFRASP